MHLGVSFYLVYTTVAVMSHTEALGMSHMCIFVNSCLPIVLFASYVFIIGEPWLLCYPGGSGSIAMMAQGVSHQLDLFNSLLRLSTNKKIKAPHCWPFVRDSPFKGPVMRTTFFIPWHHVEIHVLYVVLFALWRHVGSTSAPICLLASDVTTNEEI